MILLFILMIVVVLFLAVLAYFLDNVKLWRTWGATDEEIGALYPADELVPDANMKATRAITIDAPIEDVWPWIAQIGRGAGWYSVDRLDNGGKKSADYIMDIPKPAVGDKTEVGRLSKLIEGRSISYFLDDIPFSGAQFLFGFNHHLNPLGEKQTRLVLVVRAQITGNKIMVWFGTLLNDIMETIMGIVQMKNLKRVIESYPKRLKTGDIHKVPGKFGHQKYEYEYAKDMK